MTERSPIGGKAEGLVWLAKNKDLGYKVPRFEIIDASYHEEFRKKPIYAQLTNLLARKVNPEIETRCSFNQISEGLERKCQRLARIFAGRGVSVRSSAVLSEDGSSHSGAGIYETHFIREEELTPEAIVQAVLKVYNSVNSPKAVEYRESIGVEDEQMGVVVQKLLGDSYKRFHGVVNSRLPAVKKVIPITLSSKLGEVVDPSNSSDAKTYFYQRTQYKSEKDYYGLVYESDNELSERLEFRESKELQERFLPLIKELRGRYGRDFEAEFTIDFDHFEINMLQIRPMTNIQDVKINFPRKRPIFIARLCMNSGEYIGPWVSPREVSKGWKEPENYAYVAGRITQSLEKANRDGTFGLGIWGRGEKPDYHLLTPKKKAMVMSHIHHGSHALTLANEQGILCVGDSSNADDRFFKPRDEDVGPYIHIVSDGLKGRVYRATKEEAVEFAKNNGLEEPK
jgi:phosphoenolpyruvate synthase/pyruvate phosphate dikinase